MPGPAARVGDSTVHGGVITGPGVPNVLIGGMPASVVGDLHVCPMATPGTPPIPHVGGPISSPGAPTVLIGGRPAATIGSICVCVGPPDSVVMGAPTVILGAAGTGAGSAGSGGGGGAAGANASAAAASSDTNESVTKEEHWLDVAFIDKAGLPVSGVPYRLKTPDGRTTESALRLDGRIRRDALPEGQAEVTLLGVREAKWNTAKMTVEEKVTLSAVAEGFGDGTPATLVIYQRDLHGPDRAVAHLQAKVKGEAVEATWRYEYPADAEPDGEEELVRADGERTSYSAPHYYFEVIVGPCTARSGILDVMDHIEIELTDGEGKPVGDQSYVLVTSAGEMRRGKLDGSGTAREDGIPPAGCVLRFVGLPDLDAAAHPYDATAEEAAGDAPGTRPPGSVQDDDICFRILGDDGPAAHVAYKVEIGSRVIEGVTDRQGWIAPIPAEGASALTVYAADNVYHVEIAERYASEVDELQSRLNALGYSAGPVDGKIGPRTRAAVAAFQKANSLEITGEASEVLMNCLRNVFRYH